MRAPRYVLDVGDGAPALVMPAKWCAVLEKHFDLDRVRVAERGRNSDFDELMTAWHVVASQHIGSRASRIGSVVDDGGEVGAAWLSTKDVAVEAQVSLRAVTLAANKGQLRGRFVAGRWTFSPTDVAEWQRRRAR